MEMTPAAVDVLDAYLAPFLGLAGDRRTAALLAATVRGIIASESLVCARIAAFSPSPGCRAA
ncbi:MAG: hypothetical protein AB7L18_12465 [Hyphomicrobiaceae bacterium]